MTQYKLIYFQGRGRAEIIRLIFVQAGVEYENRRIGFEEWGELKPTTPFGYLPVLEVNGKMLSGSMSIAYYVAQKFGLAGENEWEKAEIGGFVDALYGDVAQRFTNMLAERDETRKEELKKKYEEGCLKTFEILEKKVSAEGWLYGSKVTYIDLLLFNYGTHYPEGMLDKFPKLKGVVEKVGALPNIAKYVKERPESQY